MHTLYTLCFTYLHIILYSTSYGGDEPKPALIFHELSPDYRYRYLQNNRVIDEINTKTNKNNN